MQYVSYTVRLFSILNDIYLGFFQQLQRFRILLNLFPNILFVQHTTNAFCTTYYKDILSIKMFSFITFIKISLDILKIGCFLKLFEHSLTFISLLLDKIIKMQQQTFKNNMQVNKTNKMNYKVNH